MELKDHGNDKMVLYALVLKAGKDFIHHLLCSPGPGAFLEEKVSPGPLRLL